MINRFDIFRTVIKTLRKYVLLIGYVLNVQGEGSGIVGFVVSPAYADIQTEIVDADAVFVFERLGQLLEPVGPAGHLPSCDLVILDFHMPGTNGGEVLRSLKMAAARSGAAPLFFLYTADKVISRQYQQLGFDGGLINKGDDESLVQQVAVALRLAKLRNRPSRQPR